MTQELVEKLGDTELVFTRVLAAPRQKVWDAWADLAQVAKWWGPEGFTITTHAREFKSGGVWRLTMHGPDGTDYPNVISYIEVTPPSRIVNDHGDEQNPKMFHTVTDFIEERSSTKIVSRMRFPSKEIREETAKHAIPGHNSTMSRLAALLGVA